MRNPIRLKNFRPRYLPYILVGLAILAYRVPPLAGFVLGGPPILVGAALRSWGAGHLVKNDALTTTGPYAHLRHPLYLGTLLVATGFALLLGGVASLALLAVVWPWFALHYFPRKDRVEGARLTALYGEAYERYRAAVPPLWPRWTAWIAPAPASGEPARAAWQLARYSDNNELGTLIAIVAVWLLFGLRAIWGDA
jgi:protein-S-isoprenylcysteine O-methyltransferase Ste14